MAKDELEDIREIVAAGIEFESKQNWDFNLGGFCALVEQLYRFLIRAREKIDPGFLGESDTYQRWGLNNLTGGEGTIFDSSRIFRKAQKTAQSIQEGIDEMCNVGGIYTWDLDPLLDEDPLGGFKRQVLDVARSNRLQAVVKRTRKGIPPNWSDVFEWSTLPRIRDFLDQIPCLQAASGVPGNPDGGAPVAESTDVKLFPFGTNPVAVVRGRAIKKMTHAQYDVVKALLQAGVTGLHKAALKKRSNREDALGILGRLAEKSDWHAVIVMAEEAGCGYRLK